MIEIVKYPHPALLRKCKTITKVDQHLKDVCGQMLEMIDGIGVGLAANQIAYPLRFFVMKSNDINVIINPVIVSQHSPYKQGIEGCLSATDLPLSIVRSRMIKVNGWDLNGNEIKKTLKGMDAVIFQHEYDHLEGLMHFHRINRFSSEQVQQVGEFITKFDKVESTLNIDEINAQLDELEVKYCS